MTNSLEVSAVVINLAHSTERLAFQKQQLDDLGISWTHIPAVSIDEISEHEYEAKANGWERKLRKTEVACFLSHKKAWEYVVEKNQPILILEDDALLSMHTKNLLQGIVNKTGLPHVDHVTLEIRNRKKLIDNTKFNINSDFDISRIYQDRAGAAAYLLFPTGAKKLLQKANCSAIALADAFICSEYALVSYQVLPAAAIQSDQCEFYNVNIAQTFPSTIAKTVKDKPKTVSLKDKITFKYRRIISQVRMAIRHISVITKSSRVYVLPRKEDFR